VAGGGQHGLLCANKVGNDPKLPTFKGWCEQVCWATALSDWLSVVLVGFVFRLHRNNVLAQHNQLKVRESITNVKLVGRFTIASRLVIAHGGVPGLVSPFQRWLILR